MDKDIDQQVAALEKIGYFGQLDENIGQRLRNGWNGMLADTFGNNRSKGKLEIGQLVIGLEKDYKKWLGANGIKNPTRGDFNRFIGIIEQTHGVKFGANGVEAAPQSTPAQSAQPATAAQTARAAQPASPTRPAQPTANAAGGTIELTANNPTVTLDPANTQPPHRMVNATLQALAKGVARSGSLDQAKVAKMVANLVTWGKTSNHSANVKAALNKFATDHADNEVGKWVASSMQPNESVALSEAANMDEPFSMGDARKFFQAIARHHYNNSTGAGAASNGGGTTSTDADTTPTAAAAQPTQQPSRGSSNVAQNIRFDPVLLQQDLIPLQTRHQSLAEFIAKTSDKSCLEAGQELKGAANIVSGDVVYAVLVAYLRAIARGNA